MHQTSRLKTNDNNYNESLQQTIIMITIIMKTVQKIILMITLILKIMKKIILMITMIMKILSKQYEKHT